MKLILKTLKILAIVLPIVSLQNLSATTPFRMESPIMKIKKIMIEEDYDRTLPVYEVFINHFGNYVVLYDGEFIEIPDFGPYYESDPEEITVEFDYSDTGIVRAKSRLLAL